MFIDDAPGIDFLAFTRTSNFPIEQESILSTSHSGRIIDQPHQTRVFVACGGSGGDATAGYVSRAAQV